MLRFKTRTLLALSAVISLLLGLSPAHARSAAAGHLLIVLTMNCSFGSGDGTAHPRFLLYSDGTALYHRDDRQVYYQAKLSNPEVRHLLQTAHKLDSIVRIDNSPDTVGGGCRIRLWYDNRSVTLYGGFGSQENLERTPTPFLELWDQLGSYHHADEVRWHSDPFYINLQRVDASPKPTNTCVWPDSFPPYPSEVSLFGTFV